MVPTVIHVILRNGRKFNTSVVLWHFNVQSCVELQQHQTKITVNDTDDAIIKVSVGQRKNLYLLLINIAIVLQFYRRHTIPTKQCTIRTSIKLIVTDTVKTREICQGHAFWAGVWTRNMYLSPSPDLH